MTESVETVVSVLARVSVTWPPEMAVRPLRGWVVAVPPCGVLVTDESGVGRSDAAQELTEGEGDGGSGGIGGDQGGGGGVHLVVGNARPGRRG